MPNGEFFFDPTSGIADELFPNPNRGRFNAAGIGKEGIITIRAKNNTATQKRVEIFNNLRHITKTPANDQYSKVAGSVYQPLNTNNLFLEALKALQVTGKTPFAQMPSQQRISPAFASYEDVTGNLIYIPSLDYSTSINPAIGSSALADAFVSCSQMPYRTLVELTAAMVLRVRLTKLQVSLDQQLFNPLEFVRYKALGGTESNSLEPSEFFDPQNQQSKVVNISRGYLIDNETGIYLTLEPNADIQLTLFISAFRNNAISAS
jgi:hypothetical protein